MKKQKIFAVLLLLIAAIVISILVATKDKPKEVYLDGVEQEDGTIRYEGDDGMYAIVGEW